MNPSDIARALQALRKNPGRKPKLSPCKLCGLKFSARAMREHLPQCRKARKETARDQG